MSGGTDSSAAEAAEDMAEAVEELAQNAEGNGGLFVMMLVAVLVVILSTVFLRRQEKKPNAMKETPKNFFKDQPKKKKTEGREPKNFEVAVENDVAEEEKGEKEEKEEKEKEEKEKEEKEMEAAEELEKEIARQRVAQANSFKVKVPDGAKPGDTFQATAPNGQTIHLTVPDGASPGTELEIVAQIDTDPETLAKAKAEALAKLKEGIDALENKDYEEALKFIKASLDMYPNYSPSMFHLGCLFLEKNNPQQACTWLVRAHQRSVPDQTDPSQFDILFKLATAFGKFPDGLPNSVKAFEEALTLDPTNEECKKLLEQSKKLLAGREETSKQGKVVVTIPEGAKPGEELQVKLPNGEVLKLKLPPNAKPGQTITISMPEQPKVKKQDMAITIPEGAAGKEIMVKGPHGEEDQIRLQIPPDAEPGTKIKISREFDNPKARIIFSGMRTTLKDIGGASAAELNGQAGTVIWWDTEQQRWSVNLDNGIHALVPSANVTF